MKKERTSPSKGIAPALWLSLVAALGVAASVAPACSSDETGGTGPSGTSSGTASTTGTGTGTGGAGGGTSTGTAGGATTTSSSGAGGIGPCPSPCANQVYECGDCEDNDSDGLIDSQDPDCLGACDNTENSYYPNLPGAPGGPCKSDCFWDNGNGSGNDDCYWDHQCDPLEVAPDYPPEGVGCAYDDTATPGPGLTCAGAFAQQSQTCLDFCGPLAPNGCDCFGCCELPAGGGKFVWLGSEVNDVGSCTLADVADPTKCKPCTFVPGCGNPCETCELCVGKDELPPECFTDDGGIPMGQCPDGVQACGLVGQDPCPINYYCVTGCCQKLPN